MANRVARLEAGFTSINDAATEATITNGNCFVTASLFSTSEAMENTG